MDKSSATDLVFPIEAFTPFPTDTVPTAENVRTLRKEILQCAMAIPSSLGGGQHGHAGLILTAAEYLAMLAPGYAAGAAVPAYVRPVQPTLAIAANAAGPLIATRTATYQRNLQEFATCNKLEQKLKNMILKAVPRVYLSILADETFEFANVTAQNMLGHLILTYGTINEDDLAMNLENCEAAWDPNTPLEGVFANTLKCAQFAAAGNDPISDANKVRLTLKAIEKSGVMEEPISDWRKKPVAQRTWANMAVHFTTANKERLRKTTAAQAGFNSANATQQQQQRRPSATSATPSTTIGGMAFYYCFTHGLGKNADHTSATCTNPCPEHKRDATADNMMGGNNTIRRRRNERSVITRPPRTAAAPAPAQE